MTDKERKINFIKGFSTISVNKICKENNISRANLVHGKISEEKLNIIYNALMVEISEMIKEVYNNESTITNI